MSCSHTGPWPVWALTSWQIAKIADGFAAHIPASLGLSPFTGADWQLDCLYSSHRKGLYASWAYIVGHPPSPTVDYTTPPSSPFSSLISCPSCRAWYRLFLDPVSISAHNPSIYARQCAFHRIYEYSSRHQKDHHHGPIEIGMVEATTLDWIEDRGIFLSDTTEYLLAKAIMARLRLTPGVGVKGPVGAVGEERELLRGGSGSGGSACPDTSRPSPTIMGDEDGDGKEMPEWNLGGVIRNDDNRQGSLSSTLIDAHEGDDAPSTLQDLTAHPTPHPFLTAPDVLTEYISATLQADSFTTTPSPSTLPLPLPLPQEFNSTSAWQQHLQQPRPPTTTVGDNGKDIEIKVTHPTTTHDPTILAPIPKRPPPPLAFKQRHQQHLYHHHNHHTNTTPTPQTRGKTPTPKPPAPHPNRLIHPPWPHEQRKKKSACQELWEEKYRKGQDDGRFAPLEWRMALGLGPLCQMDPTTGYRYMQGEPPPPLSLRLR
ncbi:hypothetical protein QBC41DRAFT_393384 [Cercophora samala]|uniref:Uncharacterized protein n=1 Tax=Cercophora samala TaxID=330535 RepID=A0AA40DB76_9PEZI|nr:hypothetical protein QBC41DRAFT_393384 [Cercophora samala]